MLIVQHSESLLAHMSYQLNKGGYILVFLSFECTLNLRTQINKSRDWNKVCRGWQKVEKLIIIGL